MLTTGRPVLLALLGTMLALAPSQAQAEPEFLELVQFSKELPVIAKKIQAIVVEENQTAVAVGDFSGPPSFAVNAGPGIREALIHAIEALDHGFVQQRAELAVSGKYAFVDRDDRGGIRRIMKLTVEIINQRKDETVKTFVVHLTGNTDIAKFSGQLISLPPEGTSRERNAELRVQMDEPKCHIEGARIRNTADSPFALEIRVKSADATGAAQPRTARVVEGRPFVEIRQGEIYEIVAFNHSGREVGVAITIDGLDVFQFSEVKNADGRPRYTHYLIAPKESTTVLGWHYRDKPPDNFSSFLVTEYGKGASAKVARPSQGKIGVITVAFSYTFPKGTSRAAGAETGFGPPRSATVEAVERLIDPAHEFISVRYLR